MCVNYFHFDGLFVQNIGIIYCSETFIPLYVEKPTSAQAHKKE